MALPVAQPLRDQDRRGEDGRRDHQGGERADEFSTPTSARASARASSAATAAIP